MPEQPFIVGVNYWPPKKAMFMWREFDRSSIDEDMSIISELGLSCVGISLLWEDFQPHPKSVLPTILDRLVSVLEIADDKNLAVLLTLFTGYAGGLIWLPPWMLRASTEEARIQVFSQDKVRRNVPRNPYSDHVVMEAQILFLRELLSAVSGHPTVLAWNLGNEFSFWAVPPGEFSGGLWLQAMTETLKEKDDAVSVTLGLGMADLTLKSGLNLILVAQHLDYVCLRVNLSEISWSEGHLDTEVLPFLGAMTRWLAKKPVLALDFGLPTIPTVRDSWSLAIQNQEDLSLFSEDEVAEFLFESIANLRRFRILGGFWKSFGDYHPSIWDWPPLDRNTVDRFCGLLRHDGSPKPAAAVFSSMPSETEEEELSWKWIDVGEDEYYQNPTEHLGRLYRRFREYYSLG